MMEVTVAVASSASPAPTSPGPAPASSFGKVLLTGRLPAAMVMPYRWPGRDGQEP
jgi:hypothetical protein